MLFHYIIFSLGHHMFHNFFPSYMWVTNRKLPSTPFRSCFKQLCLSFLLPLFPSCFPLTIFSFAFLEQHCPLATPAFFQFFLSFLLSSNLSSYLLSPFPSFLVVFTFLSFFSLSIAPLAQFMRLSVLNNCAYVCHE